jgi:hypothetical protein
VKTLQQPQPSKRTKRRTRMSKIRTFFGILFAGLALAVFLLAYLADFKRVRGDLERWLAEFDRRQRRGPESGGHFSS